jgi:hypothetical protein
MRWTTAATTGLLAAALAGCGPKANRPGAETGAASDTAGGGMTPMPADTTGAMSRESTGADTAMRGMSHDTGAAARSADSGRTSSGKPNQSESGVTNPKSKSSTLGPGATQTRPDQGQPVTSKGDTINQGIDSTSR